MTLDNSTNDEKYIEFEYLINDIKYSKNIKREAFGRRDWLFPGRNGAPITRVQMHRWIKSWIINAGLDERFYSAESFRRTLALEIYKNTKNIEYSRQALQQKSLKRTLDYMSIEKYEALQIVEDLQILED